MVSQTQPHDTSSQAVPILLGLGANLGDRRTTLEAALDALEAHCGPLTRSSFYETSPWGDLDQPAFLNLVASGITRLAPVDLLDLCKTVERDLGRTATRRWGPRVVDVDVLAYGDQVITLPTLTVPHAHLHQRAFVLVPLAELAPNWRHPILGKTAVELLATLPEAERSGIVRV